MLISKGRPQSSRRIQQPQIIRNRHPLFGTCYARTVASLCTRLIGHIVDEDVRDTTDKINALDGVYVVGFDIKLNGEDESTALIKLETDYGCKQFAFDEVAKIADEKDLIMINEV